MRRRRPERRQILPDPVYNDKMVAKFVNYIMTRGKKGVAEKIFSKLFENFRIKKVLLRIEKLDVIKNTTSVGIELEKTRSNEY